MTQAPNLPPRAALPRLPVKKPTPAPARATLVAPSALARALDIPAQENLLPALEYCTVDWQGGKGDGKTVAALGNPWGVALKFCDGPFIRTRCAAEVRIIRTLADFDTNIADLLRVAERDGTGGKYRTLIIDPTFMWQNMLANRYLAEVNGTDQPPKWRSIREHPDGAKKYFPMIADDIGRTIERFTACGWGVHTCTHYKKGLVIDGPTMASAHGGWVPDVAGGVAGAIDKYMVLRAVCEAINVEGTKLFDVSFASTKYSGAGSSRVPILGDIELPNYNDPKTPRGITSFMVIRKAVAAAASSAHAQESDFQAYIAEHPLTDEA